MLKIEATLDELEAKLVSYENFKAVLQQYMQRLLGSDQDTLAIVSEMLDTIKSLSAARSLSETPAELRRVVELKKEALYRYGGVAHVEGVQAPPLLEGGIVKVDDPQVYGLSLICTWLDCIISNPEQSLNSLRRVFLRASDPWAVELNRIFHIDLGRLQPIAEPELWLADLVGDTAATHLTLSRVLNVAQALGLEPTEPVSHLPLAVWRHLLKTRPAYDLSDRFSRGGSEHSRLIALQREEGKRAVACLYRLGTTPPPAGKLPPPISLGELAQQMGCSLATPVRLELVEKAGHLSGNTPSIFTADMPLGQVEESFSMALNNPPRLILQDVTPPAHPPSQRLLRVASAEKPERQAQVFRIQPLPQEEWPERKDRTHVYRFHDLADIGVGTCPPDGFLEVVLGNDRAESRAEVHFHRWGRQRASLHITAGGLRRAAQTGTLILLGAGEETALDVLDFLQGLIGPAAQEIEPVVSQLDCQVRWRTRFGEALFKSEA